MRVYCDDRSDLVWRLRLEAPPGGDTVLSAEGLGELQALLDEAAGSEHCRMLVLQGADGVFCRGMDLTALAADPDEQATDGIGRFADCLRSLRDCRQLVIALVDGVAVGGGVGLAAAADLLVATRRSSFGLPEVVMGLVPALVLAVLLERMAPQKARRFALRGTSLTADEALALGLCDEVVTDAAELERSLRQIARQTLRLEPEAVGRTKRLGRELAALGPDQRLAHAAEHIRELLGRTDKTEVIASYLEGEPLPWFARWRPAGARAGAKAGAK